MTTTVPDPKPVFSFYYIGIDTEAGVTPQQFETFVREQGVHIPCYPGWRWTLLRGLRGERVGQYLMLYEIDSAEQRDRYVTATGQRTAHAHEFWRRHAAAQEILAEWRKLGTYSRRCSAIIACWLRTEKATCRPARATGNGRANRPRRALSASTIWRCAKA